MANQYEKIPVPGFYKGDSYVDKELLASSNPGSYRQKGVTMAGGQGVIELGCVLARNDNDKKYYPYAPGGANGLGTPRGVLRRSVDLGPEGAVDQVTNILETGILKLQYVHVGKLLADADSADLAAVITALGARTNAFSPGDGTFIF